MYEYYFNKYVIQLNQNLDLKLYVGLWNREKIHADKYIHAFQAQSQYSMVDILQLWSQVQHWSTVTNR